MEKTIHRLTTENDYMKSELEMMIDWRSVAEELQLKIKQTEKISQGVNTELPEVLTNNDGEEFPRN